MRRKVAPSEVLRLKQARIEREISQEALQEAERIAKDQLERLENADEWSSEGDKDIKKEYARVGGEKVKRGTEE